MIVSMTGFASKSVTFSFPTGETLVLSLQMKSLNSRFFESTCKLPYALSHLETELIPLFKKNLKRGHLFFAVSTNNSTLLRGTVEPSHAFIKTYIDASKTIKRKYSVKGELTISDLMQLPNIFSTQEQAMNPNLKKTLMSAINELIETLAKRRIREGNAIKKDLILRHKILLAAIKKIEKNAELLMKKKKKEIANVVQELGNKDCKDSVIQRSSLYNELNKIDIHEEIVRFKSHLQNLKNVLTSPKIEKGKHLDFIMQELTRETNTIAAKASSATISTEAVTIKVELEKIREQTQNIV